ncbi:MAG TPA: kelch repeat-containing protein [Bryobacteraceae bacterium]|nr:kelch repeat-containing protein [Bryobacteraceae bacterium]
MILRRKHRNTIPLLACLAWGSLLLPAAVPNSWTLGTPMPTAREGPFTGVVGTKIYVIGGQTNSTVLSVNEIYDTVSNTWSTGAPMPTARYFGASAVVNNIIYVIAGASNSSALNVVEAYNPATDTWSTKTPLPIENDNVYATVENNIIYVIGGFNSSHVRLTTVLAYNPASDTWSTVAPMKVGRSTPASGLIGSTLVVAGGLGNSGVTNDNEGYNAATNSWTTLAPVPTPRQAGCFESAQGMLYFAGGVITNGDPLTVLEAYNASTNTWTTGLPKLPHGIVNPGSASAGGVLYCFGGTNNGYPNQGSIYNYVQIYQPAFEPPSIGAAVSAGSFGGFTSVSPGSWIEIYGSNLASDTRSWGGSDFSGVQAPTTLDGTSVTIGGQAAFVDFISPGQVDAQVPSNVETGLQQITIQTSIGTSTPFNVTVNSVEPGLLAPPMFSVSGIQYAAAVLPDGAYALPAGAIGGVPSHPAKPGDTVTLYGVGFGPVTPDTPAGQIVEQSNKLANSFQISFAGMPASLAYFGLAPSLVGLYQFDALLPNVGSSNAVPLTFILDGKAGTQTLYISVQN